MLFDYCNENLLGLQDVEIKNIRISADKNIITVRMIRKPHICLCCGKRFSEKAPFHPRYHRMTNHLICFVLDKLRSTVSFTHVAKEVNLSVHTVMRIFDFISFKKPKLPEVIAIDEFKGNTSGEKYNCIITDPVNHKVIDILPKRFFSYLSTYLKHFDDRERVKLFISDMWKPYADIASVYFKNAK